jgi:indole-3-glycerol phosphate synthase
MGHLDAILERKRREIMRRHRHAARAPACGKGGGERELPGSGSGLAALARRSGDPIRVIAEIKRRSPSAGVLRPREIGDVAAIARAYEAAGAAAVSVLADGPAFGGCVLDVRRAACAVRVPVLFKEFVLDEVQIDAARAAGASLVLLLVRALSDAELVRLAAATRERGMEAVVEAADEAELRRALATGAAIVGVNARDLRSFEVDPLAAARAIESVPNGRVAVYMSGVGTAEELARVGRSRADAVLVGTELVRAADPGARLRQLIEGAR